jgi:hypothetical protein
MVYLLFCFTFLPPFVRIKHWQFDGILFSRDFSGVLTVLSSEFNIDNFIRLYVESLVDYR